jgi:hypothetical protein
MAKLYPFYTLRAQICRAGHSSSLFTAERLNPASQEEKRANRKKSGKGKYKTKEETKMQEE